MSEQETPSVPPGWYPDPKMVGTQRYWDGAQWTEHAAPAPQGKPNNDNSGLVAAGILTAIFIPFVGFVLGIVLLAKGNNKWGLRILLGSVGFFLLWLQILQPDEPTTYYYGGY